MSKNKTLILNKEILTSIKCVKQHVGVAFNTSTIVQTAIPFISMSL